MRVRPYTCSLLRADTAQPPHQAFACHPSKGEEYHFFNSPTLALPYQCHD